VEPTAPFFARRFADMDWRIVTPARTAIFVDGALSFAPGQPRPPLPEDATEALWTTYFRNIFNPARVKTEAMRAEMPKKYWKNMPETRAIPQMLAEAQARVQQMAAAQPTRAPAHARPAQQQAAAHDSAWEGGSDALAAEIRRCTRCPLHEMATQAVPGEGDWTAELMIVGEQPGDREDLAGRPFVGPAGAMLDEGLQIAHIDRARVFVTNAVKHFRFQPRGKRRIHQRPDAGHIEACRWWLEVEQKRLDPKLVLAMGATALHSLTGSGKDILKRRGGVEETRLGHPVLVTVHPAYLLRIPEAARKAEETARFHDDLRAAARHLAA
jgi:DNA polymerase